MCISLAAIGYGQSLDNEQIEGLCIYKVRAAAPDSVATIFEYRSTLEYPSTKYIFPASGSKMRIPPAAEYHCIPYPGRSDLDRRTALTLVKLAKARFPQFEKILTRLEKGWKSFDRKKEIDTAVADQRHFRAEESVKKMASRRSEQLPPPAITPSTLSSPKLKTTSLQPAKPATSPKGTVPPSPDVPKPVPAGDPDSLKKNLEVIKSAYGTAGQMLEAQPTGE